MDYQQKAAALDALSEISIKCRGVKDWYVSQQVDVKDVKDGHVLYGEYGNGETPEEAILDHWRRLVEDLPRNKYLVVRGGSDQRRAVRWNGFMWVAVQEPKPVDPAAA